MNLLKYKIMLNKLLLFYYFIISIYPSLAKCSISIPLKMSENLWFSDVFRGYRNGTSGYNALKVFENAVGIELLQMLVN